MLKLKTSKFVVRAEIEFAGSVINASMVKGEDDVTVQPKDGWIKAFENLK